jgi:hypothetical protein
MTYYQKFIGHTNETKDLRLDQFSYRCHILWILFLRSLPRRHRSGKQSGWIFSYQFSVGSDHWYLGCSGRRQSIHSRIQVYKEGQIGLIHGLST